MPATAAPFAARTVPVMSRTAGFSGVAERSFESAPSPTPFTALTS